MLSSRYLSPAPRIYQGKSCWVFPLSGRRVCKWGSWSGPSSFLCNSCLCGPQQERPGNEPPDSCGAAERLSHSPRQRCVGSHQGNRRGKTLRKDAPENPPKLLIKEKFCLKHWQDLESPKAYNTVIQVVHITPRGEIVFIFLGSLELSQESECKCQGAWGVKLSFPQDFSLREATKDPE